MDNQGLRNFFCVNKKVALQSKRMCKTWLELFVVQIFFLLSCLTAAGSAMVFHAIVVSTPMVVSVPWNVVCLGNNASGKESKTSGTVVKLPRYGGSPTLVSSWFLLYIKWLLFFSTKQCTYTCKPFSLSYLQALWMNFLTPWTFLSWLRIESGCRNPM